MDENARMKILEMIEAGIISAEEGLKLLQTLSQEDQVDQPVGGSQPASPAVDKPFFVIETGTKAKEASAFQEPSSQAADFETGSDDDMEHEVGHEASTQQPAGEFVGDSEPSEQAGTAEDLPHASEAAYAENSSNGFAGENSGKEPSSDRASQPFPADIEKWQRWWMIPLWVGVGVTILAGLWMYNAFLGSGFGFWFLCAWIPFLLGVGLMALSYSSQRSRWLHLRVDQKPGERPQHIALSMPLPLGLVSWFFKYFGHFIPNIPEGIHVEEILQAVSENTNPDTPLYVEVDEGDNGEKVKLYIG
jgi:hypothetical protein